VTASTASELLVLDREGFTTLRRLSGPTEADLFNIAGERLASSPDTDIDEPGGPSGG
jgi:hypothetical protein